MLTPAQIARVIEHGIETRNIRVATVAGNMKVYVTTPVTTEYLNRKLEGLSPALSGVAEHMVNLPGGKVFDLREYPDVLIERGLQQALGSQFDTIMSKAQELSLARVGEVNERMAAATRTAEADVRQASDRLAGYVKETAGDRARVSAALRALTGKSPDGQRDR